MAERRPDRRSGTRFVVVWLLGASLFAHHRQSQASSGDGSLEPNGRGLQLLRGREAILLEQSAKARRIARERALSLYRLLRTAALERPPADSRALALGTAVLVRDLTEARSLRAELERVRTERAALQARCAGCGGAAVDSGPGSDAIPVAQVGGPAPSFLRPVAGPLATPFGVGRDPTTGAWIFRVAATFAARPGEQVRSPVEGRVHRVAGSVAGGAAVVLVHGGDGGWTLVLSGLDSVAVAPGEIVRRGDAVGRAWPGPGAAVRVEAWHGRTPVDPAAVLRAR